MKLINPLVILKTLGIILLIETGSFLFCIPAALCFDENLTPFLFPAAITAAAGGILFLISHKADTGKFSNREGYFSVVLAWLIFALFGTLPYIFSGTIPSFVDAFFESTSGFTTTGSSILPDVESLPGSILFWRSLTHWIGGIGVIVLVLLVLPTLNVSGYQLFSLELNMKEKILPRSKAIALKIVLIYFTLTITEILLLYSSGSMDLLDSICYSFGTISAGGFSTKNTGMMNYSQSGQYIVMIFMFLAGISQVIYYYLLKLNFRKIKHNEELWFYIATIIISGALASSIILVNSDKPLEPSLREGYFQVISIITCTGYSSADFIKWPAAGTLLLFILMFSGGSTCSTSGGIKMARHLIVIKNIKSVFIRLSHPNQVVPVRLNGKIVDEGTNISILSFIVLYLFVFMVGTVLVIATGLDPVSASSSVATCMAGIGPGLGSVGPLSSFAAIPLLSKLILSILMLLGRLEIIIVIVLFSKSFWKL